MIALAFLAVSWSSLIKAFSVPEADYATSEYKLHSEFTVSGIDKTYQILMAGFDGKPSYSEVSGKFTPSTHYTPRAQLSKLKDRDVCVPLADCYGQAASSALAWGAAGAETLGNQCTVVAEVIYETLVSNDYELAKQAVASVPVAVAVTLVTGPTPYYINAKLISIFAHTTDDVCGSTDPYVFAENAATAVGEFCCGIGKQTQDQATTRYVVSDALSSTNPTPIGNQALAEFFVSSQAGVWASSCSDYGITWKKMLRRGLEYLAYKRWF